MGASSITIFIALFSFEMGAPPDAYLSAKAMFGLFQTWFTLEAWETGEIN